MFDNEVYVHVNVCGQIRVHTDSWHFKILITNSNLFPSTGSTYWAPDPGWAGRVSAGGSARHGLHSESSQPPESVSGRDSAAGQSQKHPSALLWGGRTDWEEYPGSRQVTDIMLRCFKSMFTFSSHVMWTDLLICSEMLRFKGCHQGICIKKQSRQNQTLPDWTL